MEKNQNQTHYDGLDVIRGLSALFIVFYHYTTRYNQNPITDGAKTDWSFSLPWGCAAVTTFFILSGFLCSKYLVSEPLGINQVLLFLKKRFIRLYPSFFIALILTFSITHLFFPQGTCSFMDAVFNLSMMPSLFGAQSVDGAYWTLRVEWSFYFMIAFTMLFSNINTKRVIIMSWVLLSILLYYFKDNSIINTLNVLFVSMHSQEFGAGIALWLILKDKKDYFAYAMLCLCVVNQVLWQDLTHVAFYILTIIVILSICKSYTQNYFKGPISAVLKWIGSISYPIYLVHQMIGFTIIYYLQGYGYTSTWFILVPVFVSVVLGYSIHRCIEKPFIKFCNA